MRTCTSPLTEGLLRRANAVAFSCGGLEKDAASERSEQGRHPKRHRQLQCVVSRRSIEGNCVMPTAGYRPALLRRGAGAAAYLDESISRGPRRLAPTAASACWAASWLPLACHSLALPGAHRLHCNPPAPAVVERIRSSR